MFSRLFGKGVVLGCFVLVATCFYFLRVADPDLWWHIKAGEIIATTRDVPRYDTYSFTAPNARWTDHEWATNLVFFYVYFFFGGPGLTALKTLIGLGIAAVIYRLASVPHRGTHLLVFLLVSEAVACFALYRPQLLTYLFIALLLLSLSRGESIVNRRSSVVVIPSLFFLWANLHGGFLAGLALLAGYAGVSWMRGFWDSGCRTQHWRKAGHLSLILVASTLVTLANPYGHHLWETLGNELDANDLNHKFISEWE